MAPSRQTRFPQTLHERFQQRFPAEKFFEAVFPGHGTWELIWEAVGTRGEPPGGLEERASSSILPDSASGWRSPGRRNATRRRSRTSSPGSPSDVDGPGLAQRPERGREAQALGGELAGVAEGVGVGPQAEAGQLLAAVRAPRRSAPGRRCGAAARGARAGRPSGSGGPATACRRPSWWRTWPRRRRWPCASPSSSGHEHPDVVLGAPAGPGQRGTSDRRARPRRPVTTARSTASVSTSASSQEGGGSAGPSRAVGPDAPRGGGPGRGAGTRPPSCRRAGPPPRTSRSLSRPARATSR